MLREWQLCVFWAILGRENILSTPDAPASRCDRGCRKRHARRLNSAPYPSVLGDDWLALMLSWLCLTPFPALRGRELCLESFFFVCAPARLRLWFLCYTLSDKGNDGWHSGDPVAAFRVADVGR